MRAGAKVPRWWPSSSLLSPSSTQYRIWRDAAERLSGSIQQARSSQGFSGKALLLVLCGLALFIFLWRLGAASLEDWDEAIYAQVAREMVQNGDWITLHWGGEPWFEKPPLLIWATAFLFSIFGVSEFWARAASAFSGVGVIVLVYLLGRRLYRSVATGFLAAIILLTVPHFVHLARFGTMDVMLTMFIFLALYGYLRARENEPRWWYLVWLACALAILTKSAAGIVAPAAVVIALALDRELFTVIRHRPFWAGVLIAVTLVGVWHLGMYGMHGQAFTDVYLGRHVLERATTVMQGHIGGTHFYAHRLGTNFFPWVTLVPLAAAVGLRDSIDRLRAARIILIIAMLVFGLYSVIPTKLQWYVAPLYPALALLIARTLAVAWTDPRSLEFTGLMVGTGVLFLYTTPGLTLAGTALALVLTAVLAVWRCSSALSRLPFVILAVFTLVGVYGLKPHYQGGPTDSARLASLAGEIREPGDTLLVYYYRGGGLHRPTPLYYSGGPVDVIRSREDLESKVYNEGSRLVMMVRQEVERLEPDFAVRVREEAGPYVLAEISTGHLRQ
jgi:4-amino-4-deoxy-L-arabinose transferase-like glycosyltransferase